MVIAPYQLDLFLDAPIPRVPAFKGMSEDALQRIIFDVTGHRFAPKTEPRKHQLEGVALALYLQRSLLLYWMRIGKALSYTTRVATPDGWRAIGSLVPGGYVFGLDGKPTKILGVYPQGERQLYKVGFADGSEVFCDDEHLWTVHKQGKWSPTLTTMTLREIRTGAPLRDSYSKGYNYAVPLPAPVQYPVKKLMLDPYFLGVLIGDGSCLKTTSLTTDTEIVESIQLPEGVSFTSYPHKSKKVVQVSFRGMRLREALRIYELEGKRSYEKHIPPDYLLSSVQQRWALLQGLLDTDGSSNGTANVNWGTTSRELAHDMRDLILSLGGIATIRFKQPTYRYKGEKRNGRLFYQMSVRLPPSLGCPFRLKRKAVKWRPITKFMPRRAITSIKIAGKAPAVCIKVAAGDGLFLLEDYIATHNTKIGLDWAMHLRAARMWTGKGIVFAHSVLGLDVWRTEIRRHSDLTATFVHLDIDEFVNALDDDSDLLVVPWSGLQELFTHMGVSRKGDKKLYPDWKSLRIAARYFDLAIIDEIHMCQNWTSLRFSIAKTLVEHCAFRLGLTGTPTGRNPFAMWAQAYLVDGGKTLGSSYPFFEQAFGSKNENPHTGRTWYTFRKRQLPVLEKKLSGMSLSYGITEVRAVDVQPAIVELSMHGEQKRAYNEAIHAVITLKTNKEQRVVVQNTFIKLRQIASGFLPFQDDHGVKRTVFFPKPAKLQWLEELVEVIEDTKLIIYHDFIASGQLVSDMLTEHKIKHTWLYGGTEDSIGAVRAFQTGAVQVLVANSTKGGMSIDLPMADHIVFYESPVDPKIRAQAEARPLSEVRGTRPLLIDDLVCAPVEYHIRTLITEGRDALAAVTGNPRMLLREA